MRRRDGKDEPPGPGRNPHGELPRREAHQRDARGAERSGGEAVSQGQGPAGEALLHGPRADGSPARACPWMWRSRKRTAMQSAKRRSRCWTASAKRERRTYLAADKAYDTARVRRDCRERGVTPHVAHEHQPHGRLGNRCPHDSTSGIPDQPADPQAHRGVLRLEQGWPAAAQDEALRQAPKSSS